MKPFDLDEYLKNPSRELVTRDGHKARIICTDKKGGYPIMALVLIDGNEIPYTYTEMGHFEHGKANILDLFFASVKHKGWMNIYDKGDVFFGGKIYDEEEIARVMSNEDCVATIPVEWEE